MDIKNEKDNLYFIFVDYVYFQGTKKDSLLATTLTLTNVSVG